MDRDKKELVEMINQELKIFFNDFHNGHEIHFRVIKEKAFTLSGKYNEHIQKQLEQFNEQAHDIFFVPNTGGYKDQQITKYNCVFVDLDCGRKESRDYFTLEETELYKKEKLEALNQFEYEPSYVVETRNGLHAYWLVDEGVRLDQFQECEERLIAFFGGDPVVKNPARLLRVPETYWCKDSENKFLVKIIHSSRIRYDIVDLITSLPIVEKDRQQTKTHPNKKKCSTLLSIRVPKNPTHTNVGLIRYKDIKTLKTIINSEPVEFSTHDDVYDYLKRQDLSVFLGMYGFNFNCIFHDDKTPSAGIVRNEENQHYIYNCLSGTCNVSYNIIQVVENLTGMDTRSALNYLRKIYNIQYKETEWKINRTSLLEKNETILYSKQFEEKYKELNQFVKRYSRTIAFLHEFSKANINTENYADKNGNPVFFASHGYIAAKLGTERKTITQRINLLTYLGLIRKLPTEEIPKDMLVKSKEIAKTKQQFKLITYYSIPVYDDTLIQFASIKALEYKKHRFNIRAFGREMLYRALGEYEADRVFPQERGKRLSEISNENSMIVEKTILYFIDLKGWTDESEILMNLDRQNNKNNYNKLLLKRILPETLDKYGLTKRRLNKKLKEKLCITKHGYPNIIVLED